MSYSQNEESKNVFKISTGELTDKRLLGKPRMNIPEIEIQKANCIQLAGDRNQWKTFVNATFDLRAP